MSWPFAYDPHVWPALLTAALTAVLGWYGWQRRRFPGAIPFAFVCLFAFLWAVGSGFETSATQFSSKIFWIKFQGVWQAPEATTWLWFVLEYAGFGRFLTRRNLWLMFSPTLLAFVMIVTNDYHHLVWTGFQMGDHVIQLFGFANWILIAYAVVPIFATFIVLVWQAARSPHLRPPAITMLLGTAIAFGFYVLVNLHPGLAGPGERILFTMGPVSLSFAVALFRFRVLDPVPLAHSAIIKQMQSGVLVLDLQKRVVDLNPAAGQILGTPPESLLGRPAAEILPGELNVPDWVGNPELAPGEIKLRQGPDIHFYSLQLTPLNDRRDRTLGHLLSLHDVTDQRLAQAKIMEQQKVVATLEERERLARELHDGVGQVLGYVGMQAQAARKWLTGGNSEKAGALLERLESVAKDAHSDVRESILSLRTGPAEDWSFLQALKQYLASYRSNYGIQTELSVARNVVEDAFSPAAGVQLLRVIQEALTNSRKHGGARNVSIFLEAQGDGTVIKISDDGSGFDPVVLDRSAAGHFGMTFMRDRMAEIGGTLHVDSKPGSGTVVRIEVPATPSVDSK